MNIQMLFISSCRKRYYIRLLEKLNENHQSLLNVISACEDDGPEM